METATLTPRQRHVVSLVAQLATATRALPLYDVRNDTVRRSLAALLRGFASALSTEPSLHLVIGPFEIEEGGRRIYFDPDRERSLAFRLYRDGVRGLVFREGFGADELARLLSALAVRHSGLHEDDTATLLWSAGLRSVDVITAWGLRPDEGEAEETDAAGLAGPRRSLPEAVDLPLPDSTARADPQWLEIEPATIEALQRECGAETRGQDGLRLLAALARALADPEQGMRFSEVRGLCEAIRDSVLSAEQLHHLLGFVRRLRVLARSTAPWDADRHRQVVEVILSCGTDQAVHKLIHSVPSADPLLRSEMVELIDLVCPDPITTVTEALAAEDRPAARAVARQLIEHYGKRYGVSLRRRFSTSRGPLAADLLRSLTALADEATPEFLARQCAHPDPEVREEAFWHLERVVFTGSQGQGFVAALRWTEGDHRRRVLAIVERSRDRRFVPPLLALMDSGLEIDEAAEVARVIGALEGQQGLRRWERFLTPKGRFLRRRLPGSVLQQVAAAVAVAQVPGAAASHLLRLALAAAARAVRPRIEGLLEARGDLVAMERAS